MAETFQLPPTPLEEFTLANGLRVVLSPDRAIPVVSIAVYYDVGSRNEKEGRTGFAHLFEHMMFQGSENVPKAAHFQYIFNAGGTMNGTTSTERTNYFETLPSNYLPLAFWLESDRMRSLKVTQENLDNQRDETVARLVWNRSNLGGWSVETGVEGVLVQELIPPGTELILGVTAGRDGFPPVVTVGLGGVTTELYRDLASALARTRASSCVARASATRSPVLRALRYACSASGNSPRRRWSSPCW